MPVVWLIGGLTELWALFATVVLLCPGFLTSNPDSALPSGFTRGQYEAAETIPLLVLFALGFLFYALGAPTRRELVDVPLETSPVPA